MLDPIRQVARIGGVEFARIAVAAVHGFGDDTRSPAVADEANRSDSGRHQAIGITVQAIVNPGLLAAHGNRHDRPGRHRLHRLGENAGKVDRGIADCDEGPVWKDVHAGLQQTAVHGPELGGVPHPRRGPALGTGQAHRMPLGTQFLGDRDSHVVTIVVEDHDRALDGTTVENIVWCQHDQATVVRNRFEVVSANAIGAPSSTRREHDVIRAKGENIVGSEPTLAKDFDIGHARNLRDPPIPNPRIGRHAGKTAFPADAAAELASRLGQGDLVTALTERPRGLEPRGPRADDQHATVRAPGRDVLGMPSAAPLLANRRVLGTSQRRDDVFAGQTDVAGDAFAYVVLASFLDLARQERIGDARARGADQIQHAAPDLADHGVGRGKPADADDRLGRDFLDEGNIGLMVSFLRETGRRTVMLRAADIDVPKVGQLGQHLDDLSALALRRDAPLACNFVDGQTHGDGTAIAHRILGLLDEFAQQTGPVLETAAVLVATLVCSGREEVERKGKPVGRVDIYQVEADLPGSQGRLALPAPHLADVALVERAGLSRVDAMWPG